MTAYEPPPTIVQELERKAVDVLERLMHRKDTARMSFRELVAAADAIHDITSGLVPDDTSDLFARIACKSGAPWGQVRIGRHAVRGDGTVCSAYWQADKPGYAVVYRMPGQKPVIKGREAEVDVRHIELETLFTKLRTTGYVEL